MTKSMMITDPSVTGIALDIVALGEEFTKREQELKDLFQKEGDKLSDEFNKRKDFLWNSLVDLTELPRNEDGSLPSYEIDNQYFTEHGVMFINKNEECDCAVCRSGRGSLAEILGLD